RSRTREIHRNEELLAALMLGNLQRDVLVLMASRGVRAFAFSYLGVVFAIYLSQLGYSTVAIGLVLSTLPRAARCSRHCGAFCPIVSDEKRSSCSWPHSRWFRT